MNVDFSRHFLCFPVWNVDKVQHLAIMIILGGLDMDAHSTTQLAIERIKELRTTNNLSYVKFAQMIGVHRTSIYRWEEGDVSSLKSTVIQKIADVFDVNPLWVMGLDVPKEKESDVHESKRKEISNILYKLTDSQLDNLIDYIHFVMKVD